MRIAVFGAGGVGGYFGGRLAQAGEDVTFIARGHHLKSLITQGLHVESIKGDFAVLPVQATDDPNEIGIVDVVLVAVKAWQVPEVAGSMKPMVGDETFVVPLQNGVEAPFQLAEVLGYGHVLGGLCFILSFISEPGRIRHIGIDPFIQFGELTNQPSERVERLRQAFSRAQGLTAQVPSDIYVAMWRKFLRIASWSGIGAITRAPVGVFRSQPETREMLKKAMYEVLEVAHAHHIALPRNVVDETMTAIDGLPPNGTASMQRDIMEGRPSELESQNGAVVRLGREKGVETPVNRFIYHSLLPLERRARGLIDFDVTAY